VRPGFRLDPTNAEALARICARLDGLPLAIELAAARIKLFSPEALRARLEDQLGLLSAGARDLPERQQTLRGAIAWSYDLLSEGERRLLWRLAAFSGGFDVDSAEAVCGPADEIGRDVLDGIMSLID
jgi:predicted ATPase